MRYVGRGGELAALRQEAALAATGQCRIVLVLGEDGVGKSRLMAELAGADLGFRPARASGQAAPDVPPLWPWTHVLTTLDTPAPAGEPGFAGRTRYVDALVAATRPGPVLVLLDDLHRLDRASLDLLHHLADLPPTAALMVVGALGDGHPTALPAGPAVTRIVLGGLSDAETGEFLTAAGRRLPEPTVRQLRRRTDGNPRLLAEVVAQLDDVSPGDGEFVRLPIVWPDPVLAGVAARLGSLRPATRTVLAAASVVGREFDLSVLEAVLEPTDDLVDVLDDALRQRVVAQRGTEVYGFTRSIDREVLYDELGARERARLHEVTARALVTVGAPGGERAPTVFELAYHHMQASVLGGAERLDSAIAFAVSAASLATQQGQAAEAVGHLAGALRLAARAGWSTTARGRLQLAFGVARLAAGDLAPGRDALAGAARLARQAGDAELLALVALGYGPPAGSGITAPPPDTALVGLLNESLVDESRLGASLAARLHARLAAEAGTEERHLGAAATAADESGDPRAIGEACLSRVLRTGAGDVRPALKAALALGDSTMECRARLAIAAGQLAGGDVAAALRGLSDVAALEGHPYVRWHAALAAAHESLLIGPAATTDELIEAAARIGRTVGPDAAELARAVQRVTGLVLRGRAAEAGPTVAALARSTAPPAWLPALSALVAAASSERAVAVELVADPPPASPWLDVLLAEAALLLEHDDGVRRSIARLTPYRTQWTVLGPAVGNGGPVALTLARLHLAVGEAQPAAAALAQAEQTAAATAWSPHVRLVQATAATNPEDALRHARAAKREAERYGLAPLVEAADRLAAAVSGRSGPGLTPREREVARLAVQGMSIKDIAARLVIGERTVETHLASIYRKLGVKSRADLMARFATIQQ